MAMDLLDKMATYVRVIEAGSFSAAAKQLRISPAAVSRQIATLETELGASLLLRSTRRMTITDGGRRYYERCASLLREVEDAQAAVRGEGATGLLRVSAPITFGLASVVPAIPSLAAKHPDLRIDLRLEDRLIDLVLEGVDVAVRVGPPPITTELVAHRLAEFHRIAVASPGYLRRRGTPKTPDALASHDFLSHAYDTGGRVAALVETATGRTARVRLDVRFSSNAGHMLRELAIAGAGLAMLPAWFVADELARGALRRVLPGWRSEPAPVHALHRTDQRGEVRVRAFIEHLRAALPAAIS
jgi:DNA-binding transcriptional LysR family regulator